ncbi:MAG TPA: hypothetical protein VNE00_27375 [Paraburkholderia sp.]|nr:hypothetical protein [Paraburkholderia sp.]
MISSHAKQSFERIFEKAARTRLPIDSSHGCNIAPLREPMAGADTRAVVLTISSIAFRLLLILHVNEDTAAVEYFTSDNPERPFNEVFQEICNLCCGAINQELLNYFPDLGMSTPYTLSARCLPYLSGLKPELLESFAISIDAAAGCIELAATLCVCAHAPVDFIADVSQAEDTSGELELF